MTTLNSRLQLALLNRKKDRNLLEKGFTLVELLVVVIIVGILSSVALPAFLNQAQKAKIASAKALASSGAKEYQAYMVEGIGQFAMTTNGSDGITFPVDLNGDVVNTSQCDATTGCTFGARIEGTNPVAIFVAEVSSGGAISKLCAPNSSGCTEGTTPNPAYSQEDADAADLANTTYNIPSTLETWTW